MVNLKILVNDFLGFDVGSNTIRSLVVISCDLKFVQSKAGSTKPLIYIIGLG